VHHFCGLLPVHQISLWLRGAKGHAAWLLGWVMKADSSRNSRMGPAAASCWNGTSWNAGQHFSWSHRQTEVVELARYLYRPVC